MVLVRLDDGKVHTSGKEVSAGVSLAEMSVSGQSIVAVGRYPDQSIASTDEGLCIHQQPTGGPYDISLYRYHLPLLKYA